MKLPEWKYPQEGLPQEKKDAMLRALKTVDESSTSPRTLQDIADEYMFEDRGIVWPVWQALANNAKTSKKAIRDLEQKQHWYLDILLIQHPHASDAFVHRMKDLREDIQNRNSSYKGFDNNKELRAYACKRLGLPLETASDDD